LQINPPRMSPAKLIAPTFAVTPCQKTQEEKWNYGAVITSLDLNNISGKIPLNSKISF
jgi:hypothetical protein